LTGGAIAALIALPYGLAMASLMGLPPVLGVFTSILTAPVTALLGRNPVLIGGTASATVPFIAMAVRSQGLGGAAKVSLAAGIIMMAFCVMRLGRYVSRVPHSVVTGFSCGIGAMMLLSQIDIILGVASPISRSASSTLLQLAEVVDHAGNWRGAPLFLGLLVIAAASVAARWSPRAPSPLIGVAAAVLAARVFGLHEKEIGSLNLSLPDFVGFAWSPQDVFAVVPQAFALAFVTSVNLLITSRVVEHFRGRHRPMKTADADAELGAYGIANICAGMFGAPLSVGIPARSLAVVRCGGTTRLANVFHAAILLMILCYGSRQIEHIPIPALAGVTAWMGICLLDWSAWKRLPRMARTESVAFLSTALAVLVVNPVAAVAVGCSVYLARAAWVRLMRTGPHVADAKAG
jgi:SulP family sulfate permease